MGKPRTLFQKIWDIHVVAEQPGSPAVLYIDLHLVHEVTSPQAFTGLREKGLRVRRPDRTIATMDHSTPTTDLRLPLADQLAERQLLQMRINCQDFGIRLYDIDSRERGIVHVIGPEQGLTQPGMTIVCGDSHTSTHGAFGALAFGIGTSEVEHVLATQCLLQSLPKTYLVNFEGRLPAGVTAKDMILALIAEIGIGGGTGYVIEYGGEAIRALDMEARMTLCNMTIEAGARAGMIAPDETTFEYLSNRHVRAPGKGMGDRSRVLAETAQRPWSSLRPDDCNRCKYAGTHDHLRHKSRHGHPHQPAGPRAENRRRCIPPDCAWRKPFSTWICSQGARCWTIRWMWSSSAAAPTHAYPTFARPRPCCVAAKYLRIPACWWCQAPNRCAFRPRRRG